MFTVLDSYHSLVVDQAKASASNSEIVVFSSTTQPTLHSLRHSRSVCNFNISDPKDEVGVQIDAVPCVTDGA